MAQQEVHTQPNKRTRMIRPKQPEQPQLSCHISWLYSSSFVRSNKRSKVQLTVRSTCLCMPISGMRACNNVPAPTQPTQATQPKHQPYAANHSVDYTPSHQQHPTKSHNPTRQPVCGRSVPVVNKDLLQAKSGLSNAGLSPAASSSCVAA
jgi:hypothetical protein